MSNKLTFADDLKAQLSPSEYEEVHKRLHQGKSARTVALLIRDEYGKMKERSLSSMMTALNRHRSRTMADRITKALLDKGEVSRRKVVDALDIAEDLNSVTDMFRLRLVKMANMLMEMPLPPETMRSELVAFSQHLERVMRCHMELGLIQGPPKEFEALFDMDTSSGQVKFTVKDGFLGGLKKIQQEYGGESGSEDALLESKGLPN